MSGLDRKALIKSLIFPTVTFLWGIVRLITELLFAGGIEVFTGRGICRVIYIPAIISGILSALFTIFLKINTERYFIKRLMVVAVVCAVYQIIIIGTTAPLIVIIVTGISGVIYQVVRVQDDDTTPGERSVLMLSDPLIYWSIYWFAIQLLFDV